VRRFVSAVVVAGSVLAACSTTPSPFDSSSPLPGSVIPARVVADDRAFAAESTIRPRFVPCQGLSGCARTSPSGDSYPGVVLPSGVDDEIDFAQEFVLYLIDAAFVEATVQQGTVHLRVRPRERGFQMVKLDGREVLSVVDPRFSFEDESGRVICTSMWEGCG
jgi:hypothetical protein